MYRSFISLKNSLIKASEIGTLFSMQYATSSSIINSKFIATNGKIDNIFLVGSYSIANISGGEFTNYDKLVLHQGIGYNTLPFVACFEDRCKINIIGDLPILTPWIE